MLACNLILNLPKKKPQDIEGKNFEKFYKSSVPM